MLKIFVFSYYRSSFYMDNNRTFMCALCLHDIFMYTLKMLFNVVFVFLRVE